MKRLTSFLILTIALLKNVQSYMLDNNPYKHRETIDPSGNYQLEWLVEWGHKRITFSVTARTTGYVGFGLSDNGKMTGADIVIGGVDSHGKSFFGDYHAVGHQTPIRDPRQDWNLLSSKENGTHTILSFSRDFDTCDPQDYPITEDKIAVIWAYGERDDIKYHYGNRGVYQVYLLHPDHSPEIVRDSSGAPTGVVTNGSVDPNVKVWTAHSIVPIPVTDTTYWCTMHRGPRLSRKHHVIGIDLRFADNVSRNFTHHLVVYRCHPPAGRSARHVFDHFLTYPGQSCISFSVDLQNRGGPMPVEDCYEYFQSWAAGGRAHFSPPHVGFPFGLEEDEYYVIQAHYDNPRLESGIQSEMFIDLFYTSKLRENDAGVMVWRHQSPGITPSHLIPPQTPEHQVFGLCGSSCTRTILPKEGIKMYAFMMHSHNAGRRIRVQQFRGNVELPWIANDDNYHFYYQQWRNLREERKILPGDEIAVRCIYDSTQANGSIVGGFSTQQEMCSVGVHYYTKIQEYQDCNSEIISPEYRRYFLAGVENVTWSDQHLEYIVDLPHPLAGLTIKQVSDNHVDWTLDKREELQRFHLFHPHVNACPSAAQQNTVLIRYPHGARPYQPERSCPVYLGKK